MFHLCCKSAVLSLLVLFCCCFFKQVILGLYVSRVGGGGTVDLFTVNCKNNIYSSITLWLL